MPASRNWQVVEKAYRERLIHEGRPKDSEPVMAATVKDAMELLGTRNMSNLQVLENGIWVWLV